MKFKDEIKNIKIIIIVIAVIFVLITSIVFIKNINKNKAIKSVSKEPYEYFNVYSLDNKVGIIDRNGNMVIDFKYTDIYIPNQSKDVFICFLDDENYTIINKDGKEIFTDFQSITPINIADEGTSLQFEKEVLSYEENGKFGIVDYDGNKLTGAIYESVSSLKNKPGCILVKKDGLCGILDSKGNEIIHVKYNSIRSDEYSSVTDQYSKTGYIVSQKTDNGIIYGYIDYKGKLLIEPKYESISRALEYENDDIYLIFMDKGKKGVIKNKKIVIKPKYQMINYYNASNIFVVRRNEKYGFFDIDGKEILKTDFSEYSIAGNYISVKKDDTMYLYDIHGNLVNTNTYKSIIETNNPSYFIAEDEKGFYSIISKESIIENNYKNISYAFDNLFIYTTSEGKSGVLDVYYGEKVEAIYDYIIVLENSKALEARTDNQVDIYSDKMEKVLTMNDGIVQKVSDNYFVIYSKSEMKYINSNGNLVKNTEVYKDLNLYSYQSDDGKWGFVNSAGEIKVDCKYDRVTELNEYGFAGIYQEGKWGVIDKTGKVIVVPSYELDTYYDPSFIGKYLYEFLDYAYCTEIQVK